MFRRALPILVVACTIQRHTHVSPLGDATVIGDEAASIALQAGSYARGMQLGRQRIEDVESLLGPDQTALTDLWAFEPVGLQLTRPGTVRIRLPPDTTDATLYVAQGPILGTLPTRIEDG